MNHPDPEVSAKHRYRAESYWTLLLLFGLSTIVSGYRLPSAHAAAPPKTSPPHQNGDYNTVDDWWPNRLDLRALKANAPTGDPADPTFDYAAAFGKLDLAAVKKDIERVLTTSQEWWPADWGHYGGLMIRMAWHSAGTYRVTDGRGGAASGTIRFAPLNSWPDNANLDKARRLLWPTKQKYGRSLSWADLMVLTGNVALNSMGFPPFGFGGGRADVYEPTDINWGPETRWLADERLDKDGKRLIKPVAATHMGLIYVNPEGPGGKPDPLGAAAHIRMTFARMAMNDEETVALIAGGHSLGKAHGAAHAHKHVGPEPEGAALEQQGLGWKNKYKSGKGADTITSGIEGAWTYTPVKWSHDFLTNLYEYEWALTKSPGGAYQWKPKEDPGRRVRDAHDPSKQHMVMMLTTDLALKVDPAYRIISERFYKNPKEFEAAFGRAWYKLTHRDMGPHVRLLGPDVPKPQLWQDPVPSVDHPLVNEQDVAALKRQITASGLSTSQLVRTAWAAAASYRDTDKRGGANGARLRLAPQRDWAANAPTELAKVLRVLERIQKDFNAAQSGGKAISVADLIVLGGGAAIEAAALKGGHRTTVPFAPGRSDATAETTDEESFAVLEPIADGFRNYRGKDAKKLAPVLLVERADLLALTAADMAVLVGGLRVLGANHGDSKHGVFTRRVGTLSNDFFVNLLDLDLEWRKASGAEQSYEGLSRKTKRVVWTGTSVDLVFGSNSQLRAIAEVYAGADANRKFIQDFVAAWTRVMRLDRFDLKPDQRSGRS